MQQQNLEIASPLAEAVYVSKVENKSAHAVSYSTDIAAGWSTDVKSSEKNGKASVAGSLYLTASDSGSQSGEDSVYDAVSLPDSDKDFEAEAGASREDRIEDVQQAAAPVILFQGAGLKSSSAAVVSAQEDEEFDYAFSHGSREGASYERLFIPQPLPAHMLTSPHQAHLTSLAEDSEEGSDAVSESEGGLIQDDDSPTEASPAASASLDNPAGSRAVRSSLTAATGQAVGRQRAAAGTDGMFELDIDDDIEQGSGLNSFTARNTQRFSQHAAVTGAGLQQKGDRPAPTQGEQPAAGSNSTAAVAAGLSESPADALQPRSDAAGQSDKGSHSSQHQRSSGQQPLPDSVPAAALSATPILGALQAGAGAHPRGSQATSLAAGTPAGVDLEEIQLQDGVAHVPGDKADAGQAATDEWEEVNLARARELAVDAPTAAIPGDKVRYPEALNYFLSADVKAIKKTLKKSKPAHRLASCFMRMQKSSKRLEKERTRLMCLAKMQFDDSDIMHLRLLQSVYLSFVGGVGPIGRYGPHWSALGFQGTDPTTDLRGCGVLGLLHLLLLHEHDPSNAQAIFELAHAQDSEFPLAPVSLNITKWTLQMIRDRKLSSAAKKQQSAVTAASDFYIGTFYAFYNHWKDKKCTMADSGFVLKDLEKRATKNVVNMITRAGTKL